ncbi:serine-type D-Ala-D-Ala carboxypeptidase, partial [Klebsiella pneumoniae]
KDLEAPIAANQRVGEISLYDGDKVVGHYPLVTLESINKGGVFSRMSDYLHHEL